jgi:hypothetical protein
VEAANDNLRLAHGLALFETDKDDCTTAQWRAVPTAMFTEERATVVCRRQRPWPMARQRCVNR